MNIENFEHLMSPSMIVWNDPVTGQALRCCPLKEALTGDINNPTKTLVDVVAEARKVVPKGGNFYIIPRANSPEKLFRSAWHIKEDANAEGGARIIALVDKAKEESLVRTRADRDSKMDLLDKTEMRIARKGGDAKYADVVAVHAKKEELCDCTNRVKAYLKKSNETTVEILKAELAPLEVTPEV